MGFIWESNSEVWTNLKTRLSRSSFRSKFSLGTKEQAYIREKGLDTIHQHAVEFIKKRLAPAFPLKDGKQTPMRGHPVFIAQHATATCCRKCLQKWHGIASGKPLTDDEITYVVTMIMCWIHEQYDSDH